MKKLSDFLVSYIIEDTPFNAPGTAIGTPGFSSPNMRPMFPSGTTGGSVGYNTGNQTPAFQPDYSYTDQRLGGMVKARQKDAQETLNRMRRVAARQAQGAGVDPGVESKIAELENQLSQRGYGRIEDEESEKLAQGRQRAKTGRQLSNLGSGMFKTTPKLGAEQEAYDAAKTAFNIQTSGSPINPGPKYSPEEIEKAFGTSRKKSAAVDAERKAGSRISPVYQVTQGDFKTATGRDYDALNREDQRIFFDLASRGAPNWSATSGPGEVPAQNSAQFYTMRQRPTDIPKFGTSDAWYDTETGQLARTTAGSRERTAQRQSAERIDKEMAAQDVEIKRQAQEIVRREQEGYVSPSMRLIRKGIGMPVWDEQGLRDEADLQRQLKQGRKEAQRRQTSAKPVWTKDYEKGYTPDFLAIGSPDYSRAKFAKDLQMDLEDEGNRSNAGINYSTFIPDPLPLPLPLPSEPMRVPDLIPIPGEDDGNSVVNTKSQLPGNVGQYLDRVLGRKFTKFGSTKPEISSRPQAPNIDISNMRIVNAPGNVRPYTGKEDPRFINPMTRYADVLDPMRDRMLGRPMFATTSRRPKDFKPDNEGTMNAPLKLPGENWTPEDIRRMKIIR